jgi:hypothetical protein
VNNTLEELYGDLKSLDIGRDAFGGAYVRASLGDTYGMMWGYDYVFDDEGNKVIDSDGFYMRTPNMVPIGSVLPDFTMGIRNTLSWRGLDFSFLFDIRQGGKFFSLSHMWGMYSGMLAESAQVNDKGNEVRDPVEEGGGIKLDGVTGDVTFNDDDTYTVTNTAPNETYLDGSYFGWFHYYGYGTPSATSIFNGDYIKLREATIGYNLPAQWLGGFIKGIRISAYGRNLLTFNLDKPGFDPEMTANGSGNIQGLEGGLQPLFRTMGLNLKINF